MEIPAWFQSDTVSSDIMAAQKLLAMSQNLARTAFIARTLIENGRVVDLIGFETAVGLLCAKSLDLPAELGRELSLNLTLLLAEVGAVIEALQAPAGGQASTLPAWRRK